MKRKVFPLWIFFFFCGPYFFFFWHILKWYRNLFIGMGWGEGCVFFYFSCVMYCATSISSRRTHKVYYQRNICQRARMCVCVCISFLLAGLTRVSLLLFSFFFFWTFIFFCVYTIDCHHHGNPFFRAAISRTYFPPFCFGGWVRWNRKRGCIYETMWKKKKRDNCRAETDCQTRRNKQIGSFVFMFFFLLFSSFLLLSSVLFTHRGKHMAVRTKAVSKKK